MFSDIIQHPAFSPSLLMNGEATTMKAKVNKCQPVAICDHLNNNSVIN